MRRPAVVVAIVAFVASSLLALVWSQQRRLIYFPSPGPVPSAAAMLPNGQDVVVETDDGIRLGAWYFPVSGGGSAVLVCDGNGGDRSGRIALAAALNGIGLSVMLFDYRGYGGNPGKPSEDGTAADARAAQRWLATQPGVERIVYFGESLGAAVAVGLAVDTPPAASVDTPPAASVDTPPAASVDTPPAASVDTPPAASVDTPPAAVILRSPFTSLPDVGATHYPWLPVRWLLKDRYPSIERIASVHVPVMVIAGDRDEIVPEALSRRLYDAANEPKQYLTVPGAGHNDPELVYGRQMVAEIDGFLSSTGVT